jgi:predicted PurR-regulated permease PerM
MPRNQVVKKNITPVLLIPRSILWACGILLFFWFLFLLRKLILLLLLACLLASTLYPAVNWLSDKHIPRKLAVLLSYFLIALLISGIGLLISNVIIEQAQTLVTSFPVLLDKAIGFLNRIPLTENDGQLATMISGNTRMILMQGLDFARRAFNYVLLIFQGMLGIVTVLVIAFFLLSDTDYFRTTLLRLVPVSYRDETKGLLKTVAEKAGAYARGQLLVMTATGTMTSLGLYFLGVPYALTLGVLVFLLDIIPIIGPLLAAVFGIIIALAQDPMLALWTALWYFIVQQTENNFLSPLILGKSVGLHSFWILFSIFAGGNLLGIPGVILAVPIAVTIGLLVEAFYIKGFIERNEQPDIEA